LCYKDLKSQGYSLREEANDAVYKPKVVLARDYNVNVNYIKGALRPH
jgi:hypothetical protein